MTKPESIVVSTLVPVGPAEAWAAYTDPEMIRKWNFASEDWCCPSAEVDLRVGGQHTARMEPKDGSEGFDFCGTYSEVEEPAALTLVLEDGRTSRTTFKQRGNETEVTTTFDADDSAPLDLQQQGWQAILDNYRKHVVNPGA